MKYIIYGLIDVREHKKGHLRYIGKSEQGIARLKEHLKPSSLKNNLPKDKWIKKLLSFGLKPEIIILEVFDNPNVLFEQEEFYYDYFKSLGCDLLNLTQCGKGTRGYKHREDTLQKLKEKALKRDKAAYQNPHNKKKNIVIGDQLYRNCSRCKQDKHIDKFTWHEKRNSFQAYCLDCNTQYKREWKEINPSPTLPQEEYNKTRLAGARAGGLAISNNPEARKHLSKKLSKPILATNIETGSIIEFESALKAKEAGFQNSNIGQAIKYNKPYRGYTWKFKL